MLWSNIHWDSRQWCLSKQPVTCAKGLARTQKSEVSNQVPEVETCSGDSSFLAAAVFLSSSCGWKPGLCPTGLGTCRWWCLKTSDERWMGGQETVSETDSSLCIPAHLETEFYNIWLITVAVSAWYRTYFKRFHFSEMTFFVFHY